VRRVLFYDAPLFRAHEAGEGHPERPARLDAVRAGIRDAGLEGHLDLRDPRPASMEELLRVHTAAHVDRVAATSGSVRQFDPDTRAGPLSYTAALLAAGAVVDAVERVLSGEARSAFCAVRPPGHHAGPERAMGFCLFNNVAVGAAHALARGAERVLIIDFDVHHGNGTQEIFWADRGVLYISSHAHPFYPGTGALSEVGLGNAEGFTVNLPLPQGLGDGEYSVLYREIVEPLGRAFEPDLVLVSAGFDAHALDPLAGMNVTEDGFAIIARSCLGAAEHARGAVFVLEGGYALPALAVSAAAAIRELSGEPQDTGVPPANSGGEALVSRFREAFLPYWPVLR